MKILLIYYTGTYNTLYMTTILKNAFLNQNNKVICLDIFSLKINKINDFDLIGIGYPIYYHNLPKVVLDKIKALDIKKKDFFIYNTSSSYTKWNNASSYNIVSYLLKNNNIFWGEYNFLMPSTIKNKLKDDFVKYLLFYNIKYANYIAKSITNKKEYQIPYIYRFVSFINRFKLKIVKINTLFYKVDKDKCLKCRQCYELCPTKNIFYNKAKRKYEFQNKCILCMKCSYICPNDAINIGFLNKYKIPETYNYLLINSLNSKYSFKKESSKKYIKYKPYFDYLNNLFLK